MRNNSKMRETSRFNFINILRKAFTPADPKCAKKSDSLTVFFALLGSAGIKAVQKTMMKLTPSIRRDEDSEIWLHHLRQRVVKILGCR